MKLRDFKGLFNKSKITVESINNPYADYYIIDFKPGSINDWTPGEHGIFSMANQRIEGRKWRAFSLASIPEEGTIKIATRTGDNISSFKEHLISLKKGDRITMRGPFGWFKIQDETTPIVLIAGGIGITPIRALLKEILHQTKRDIILLYSSKAYYLFKDDIEKFQEKNNKIQFKKLKNKSEMSTEIHIQSKKYGNHAYYYIAGSSNFIRSIKVSLKEKEIKSSRIINDSFLGY